jgi:hypothetical protein
MEVNAMAGERINILQTINGALAVSTEDGEVLYKRIDAALRDQQHVEIDFSGIKTLTSTFLNAAIGQLYGKFDSPFLREHITIVNMAPEDQATLKRVVERAKAYFKNREQVEKGIREVIGDE